MQTPADIKFKKVYLRGQAKQCADLIISVHGMGDQYRNDMTHTVAELIAKSYVKDRPLNQALRLPQGLWEGEKSDQPEWDDVISFAPVEPELRELGTLGFAELYWADLPRVAERDGRRLEGSPQWAGSVVDRLRQRNDLKPSLSGSDLTLGATVVEEVAESLKILKNLFFLTDKAGIFTFDLGLILAQYLGDVQQVADFRYVRESMVKRFMARIAILAQLCPHARLHFVAHSEGTVLTFLTLLQAMHQAYAGTGPHEWIDRVDSMSTFGSPIDKHLILWPELWGYLSADEEKVRAAKMTCDAAAYETLLEAQRKKWRPMQSKHHIRWRNYYDKADPVGFDLDTAREKLLLWGCEAFQFTAEHDFGFRRYLLAGKAHVDYFGDVPLFEHIRESAIFGRQGPPAPQDTPCGKTSPVWPFIIVAALHLAAVFILHKSLSMDPVLQLPFAWPFSWPARPSGLVCWGSGVFGIAGGSAIMLAVTIFTRSARIAGFWGALLGWPGVYTALCLAVTLASFYSPTHPCCVNVSGFGWMMVPAIVTVCLTLLVDAQCKRMGKSPVWGLRMQMTFGGGAVAAGVVWLFRSPQDSMLTAAMGAAAFMYLWWLGVLLFDLAYVWKRYINTSLPNTYVERLRKKIKGRVHPPEAAG